jgi:hypothetical protein
MSRWPSTLPLVFFLDSSASVGRSNESLALIKSCNGLGGPMSSSRFMIATRLARACWLVYPR